MWNNLKNVCKPDCEGRSPTCHSTCEKYLAARKAYDEEKQALVNKRNKERLIDRAYRESIHRAAQKGKRRR